VGAVLGSAGIAAFMTSRIGAEMPPMPSQAQGEGSVTRLPAFLHEPFAAAMSQSTLLPAFFALFGVVAALFLLGFGNKDVDRLAPAEYDDLDEADGDAGYAVEYGGDEAFVDDDEYLEYTISWDEPETEPERVRAAEPVGVVDNESDTEPMQSRPEHVLHAPAETWHSAPVESWHSLLEDEPEQPTPEPEQPAYEPPEPLPPRVESRPEPPSESWRWGYSPRELGALSPEGQGGILDELLGDMPLKPTVEPIGFARNGFHVDDEQRFQPLPPPEPATGGHSRHERRGESERPPRHELREDQEESRPFWFQSGRHSRDDPDDASSYGRHSMPGRD
jgi:hypothetical protein